MSSSDDVIAAPPAAAASHVADDGVSAPAAPAPAPDAAAIRADLLTDDVPPSHEEAAAAAVPTKPRLSREAYMDMISSQTNAAVKFHLRVSKTPPFDVMTATDDELRAKLRALKCAKRGDVPGGLTFKRRAELERLWFNLSPHGPEEWARVNKQRAENARKAVLMAQEAADLEVEEKRVRDAEALEDASERAAIDAEMDAAAFGSRAGRASGGGGGGLAAGASAGGPA